MDTREGFPFTRIMLGGIFCEGDTEIGDFFELMHLLPFVNRRALIVFRIKQPREYRERKPLRTTLQRSLCLK